MHLVQAVHAPCIARIARIAPTRLVQPKQPRSARTTAHRAQEVLEKKPEKIWRHSVRFQSRTTISKNLHGLHGFQKGSWGVHSPFYSIATCMCAALGRVGVCLTSLLKRSNKGFFLQFRSLITLNLATGCFRMMKKGCWLPLQVPDPAFHGGILKKRAVGPRSAQGPKTLKNAVFAQKDARSPFDIARVCECACV